MFTLDAISKSFGGHAILDDVTWQAPASSIVGLVGPNGAGKTTLLRIITGEMDPDRGRVVTPRGLTLGFLPQEVARQQGEETLFEVVTSGRQDLLELQSRLRELEARIAAGHDAEALAREHGELRDRFQHAGGYELDSRAREIAIGIGFSAEDLERPMAQFSGGWQMRALLARLLLRRPDVLLLDEPTNHLDLESMEWLERFMGRYDGTVVVVSHDRYFLNRMVDQIVELDRGKLTTYVGNYDAYRRARAEHRERMAATAAQQQKEIERIQEFIERFRYKASKAAQVQSRVKMLEKIDRVDVPQGDDAGIHFEFPQPPRLPKIALRGDDLAKAFGDHVVYDGLEFVLHRGDRVALVGPNGAGKSTLLKMLAGVLKPDRGEVEAGPSVEVAYFAQHAVDQLDTRRTILEELQAAADYESAPRVRSILGAFGFSGKDVEKRISVLSGGEKSRVALAKLLLAPAGVLLLDEPTNHLDIASRQVLEFALQNFEGAFAVVSHDRYFINEVTSKVVHIEDGKALAYVGDYDYYRWKRETEAADAAEREAHQDAEERAAGARSKKELRRAAAEIRKRKQNETRELQAKLEEIEGEIEAIEERIAQLERELAAPELYDDPERAGELNAEYKRAGESLEHKMSVWEEHASTLAEIEQRYDEEEAALR